VSSGERREERGERERERERERREEREREIQARMSFFVIRIGNLFM
jgi:hypothetical protein